MLLVDSYAEGMYYRLFSHRTDRDRMAISAEKDARPHQLHRSFGLLQATAMNMSNMVGVGPFLTIPLILAAMGGPQAILGWILGALLAICDGMVWAELASAIPTSGGTFEYLKVAYAGTRLGRLLPFLFIWQFILSGPLEIASGNIGFAQYATYIVPEATPYMTWLAVGVGVLTVLLLYRKIESVGKLMVVLWVGMLLTIAVVLISGLRHFNAEAAFAFPPGAFRFSSGFLLGLGSAMTLAMYDFLGYYSVCYIGDEVTNPSRTIPRSILISVVAIAAVYVAMNVSIISVVPWQEAVKSPYIAAEFIERLYGRAGGVVVSVLICWTRLGGRLCPDAGILADSLRRRARRILLCRFRPAAPPRRFSARLVAGPRRGIGGRQSLHPRTGHQRLDLHAHPHPVHRTDRRRNTASPAGRPNVRLPHGSCIRCPA